MQNPIFRQEAIEQLSSPDQLDQLLRITRPRAWLTLLGFAAIVVAVLLWSFGGSIPLEASGRGILIRPPGNSAAFATDVGTVTAIPVLIGDKVNTGQVIARLVTPAGVSADIKSPIDGEVVSETVMIGSYVQPGVRVATIEPATSTLEAVIFVPAQQGKSISAGMNVRIRPATVRAEEFGVLLGTVTSVSKFPASPERVHSLFENQAVVQELTGGETAYEVHANILPDIKTPTGYRWSSGAGPDVELTSGTLCSADVILRTLRPASLAFPSSAGK